MVCHMCLGRWRASTGVQSKHQKQQKQQKQQNPRKKRKWTGGSRTMSISLLLYAPKICSLICSLQIDATCDWLESVRDKLSSLELQRFITRVVPPLPPVLSKKAEAGFGTLCFLIDPAGNTRWNKRKKWKSLPNHPSKSSFSRFFLCSPSHHTNQSMYSWWDVASCHGQAISILNSNLRLRFNKKSELCLIHSPW